jgi:hypothetical protein
MSQIYLNFRNTFPIHFQLVSNANRENKARFELVFNFVSHKTQTFPILPPIGRENGNILSKSMKQIIGSNWFFHLSYSRKIQDRLIGALTEMALVWIARSGEGISQKLKADPSALAAGIEEGSTGVYQNGHEVWLLTHAVFEWGNSIPIDVMIGAGPRDCIKEQAAKFKVRLERIGQKTRRSPLENYEHNN